MSKRVFAIGDIHGCFDPFKELVENIIQLQKSDKLIILGDFIDKGDKSKEVVDYIIEIQDKGFDIIPLMGNHEALLMSVFENDENISKWIQNGGNETLKSFGIASINKINPKYIKFFKDLKYYYSLNNFLFVHAGFNDNIVNPFSDFYTMLWKSKESYANPLLIDKTIIHGHSPVSVSNCNYSVESKHSVINIDTGCVYKNKEGYGRLTAYECYTGKIFSV